MSSRITIAIVSLWGFSGSELLAQNPCNSVNKLSITVEGRSTGNPDTMRISLSSSATAGNSR